MYVYLRCQRRLCAVMCLVEQHGLRHCSVDIGKALRLCHALQWVVDLGMDNVDFSLDSKLVVDVVNGNNSSNTDFGSIIKYCHRLLSNHFTNSKFTRMQANGTTHELGETTPLEIGSQLFNVPPPCINLLLSNEIRRIVSSKK